MMKRLDIKAPAKINLFLDVLGKRADDYHEIKSLVLPVSLFDRIRLEAAPAGIVTVANSLTYFQGIPWPISMGPMEDNLTTRAAMLLKQTTGYRSGARIRIEKHIPIGGGMGGGSSDAAAVLKGLNTLWNTGLSTEELMVLGSQLGCDIPALVHGGPLEINGRGERIRPVRRTVQPALWLVLVNPGICVSTGDIYARYRTSLTAPPTKGNFLSVLRGLEEGSLDRISAGLFNALQPTVYRKYPLLEIMHNELEKAGAKGVLLSGSGSTVFALAHNRAQGCKLATRIRAALDCPLWTCVVQAIEE
jgi:4-diphosphocytidyl-2-C-methyl-D-erythritol kinase